MIANFPNFSCPRHLVRMVGKISAQRVRNIKMSGKCFIQGSLGLSQCRNPFIWCCQIFANVKTTSTQFRLSFSLKIERSFVGRRHLNFEKYSRASIIYLCQQTTNKQQKTDKNHQKNKNQLEFSCAQTFELCRVHFTQSSFSMAAGGLLGTTQMH